MIIKTWLNSFCAVLYHQNNLHLSNLSVCKYHPLYIWHYVVWIISVFKILILEEKSQNYLEYAHTDTEQLICCVNLTFVCEGSCNKHPSQKPSIVLNCSSFLQSQICIFPTKIQLHRKPTLTTQTSVKVSQWKFFMC